MKKIILFSITLFFYSICFSQLKQASDTTILLPVKKDTVDVSKVRFLKTPRGIYSREMIDKSDYFLTKEDVIRILSQLGTLPYNESEKAIALIRKIFGLQ